LCWGERLRRARRRGTACERLTEALGAFTELQVDLYAERATAELAAAGVRTPGRTAEPITTLTPQERQISLLVAEGLTNREVATRLFISTNTVETHMRHMFTKLGVRSRTELARKITDFGDSARTAPP
jgi:DNA-binding NarL/FixJ family response regulator